MLVDRDFGRLRLSLSLSLARACFHAGCLARRSYSEIIIVRRRAAPRARARRKNAVLIAGDIRYRTFGCLVAEKLCGGGPYFSASTLSRSSMNESSIAGLISKALLRRERIVSMRYRDHPRIIRAMDTRDFIIRRDQPALLIGTVCDLIFNIIRFYPYRT